MDNKKSFFDKVGGTLKLGIKSKNKHSSLYGSAKSLHTYESGHNGSDPYYESMGVSSMSSSDVKDKFEKLLDDMNLTEEKKAPLRAKDTDFKRHMLTMQAKGMCIGRGKELDSPFYFIHELTNKELKGQRRIQILEALKVSLTSKPVSWAIEFGDRGLNAILESLDSCDNNLDQRVVYESVRCLKAFMNNTFGLKRIMEHEKALSALSLTVDHRDPATMLEAVRCLAAICLVPPNGHDYVLEGITTAGDFSGQDRFESIIKGLEMRDNPALQVACMQLVNAIVSTPDDLDFRLHLRNEFMRTGLGRLIKWLYSHEDEELRTQLHIFHEHKEHDQDEFFHHYDNVRMEFQDPNACFRRIMNTVTNTVAEPYFLSILQHLLVIRDDIYARPQYYKLIEECVTQIVLHRSGYDPDFSHTKRFQIDVEPLLSNLSGSSKFEDTGADISVAEITTKLDTALTAKQEAEAKAISLESKVHQYELELSQIKEGIKQNIGDNISKALFKSSGSVGSEVTPPPPPPPPPPPLTPLGGFPPPPPPLPGVSPYAPTAPVFFAQSPPPTQLPFGMAPKKKYSTNTQTKRLNWNKVNPKNLEKNSLWVSLREDEFESPDVFKMLEELFSTKPPAKKILSETPEGRPIKKGKELKVLDIKTGQNLSILLSSVKLSYEEIKHRILAVDEVNLTPGLLEQLIRCIPEPEVLKKLAALQDCYSDLAEPEQFAVVMSSIKRLVPRLSSILFKMRFPEIIGDIKPDLVSATEALDEIKNSRRFAKLLELLLLLGNYLNAGSRNAQSIGFDVSFLSKLENTKSHDGNTTMLHFLAEILEKKYPDILGFLDEIIHVDKAARVSAETLQKNITSIGKQLKDLELDLRNLGKTSDPSDKFGDVMRSFLKEAQSQFELLSAMYRKLESLYDNTAKYLAFDPKKYMMEEFFSDIKSFKDGLQKALKDNARRRDFQEKTRRASEARDKAEKEKQEKKLRQAAILDMTANDNQEGVMDSLLEILKTGSAFTVTREKRDGKRRTPRVAGAERRAQLSKNQSKQNLMENSALRELKFEDSYNISSNVNRENVRNKTHRKPPREEESEAEKLLKRLKAM